MHTVCVSRLPRRIFAKTTSFCHHVAAGASSISVDFPGETTSMAGPPMSVHPDAARNSSVSHRVPKGLNQDSDGFSIIVRLRKILLSPIRHLLPAYSSDATAMKSRKVFQHPAASAKGRKVGVRHA